MIGPDTTVFTKGGTKLSVLKISLIAAAFPLWQSGRTPATRYGEAVYVVSSCSTAKRIRPQDIYARLLSKRHSDTLAASYQFSLIRSPSENTLDLQDWPVS